MQSNNGKLAIIFFGIKDMSFDYYLKKSYQKYLETEIKINSIYDALVYYNCYLCLTSGFKLKELSKEEFSSIENWAETKVKIEVYKYISKNCLLFTEKDFSNLNYKYKEQFLDLCYKIGLIKNWSNSDFENLSSNFYVRILLGNKKIVEKFGVVIKKKLFELNNKELVGLYISTFQESINDPQQLSFPSEISTKEWEKQIEIFVQESTANDINTLTIISQLQSQKKINIPNKVKFEAKVKTQKFNDEILKSSKNFIKENIEVRLEKNQDRNCSLIKLEFKEGQLLIIYNSTYLEATTSLPEILNNLSSVFSILDENQMLKIAQNPPDEGILALSRIKVKENYNPSDNFNRNFCISLGSFRLYYHFLKSKGIDLENIASQFFQNI